jgi:hypothetical protein
MRWTLLVAVALCACGGDKNEKQSPAPVLTVASQDAAPVVAKAPPPVAIESFETDGDEAKALAKAEVMHAWRAVDQRWRLLARRGEGGAVWGSLGESIDEHQWLIDETEGVGSLAIRVRLPAETKLAKGERVVIWGGWKVDGKRRWYWEARRVARLGGKSPSDVTEFAPGHDIKVLDARPKGSVPISKLKRRGDVVFEVVNAPMRVGEGWIVADRAKWPKIAILSPTAGRITGPTTSDGSSKRASGTR